MSIPGSGPSISGGIPDADPDADWNMLWVVGYVVFAMAVLVALGCGTVALYAYSTGDDALLNIATMPLVIGLQFVPVFVGGIVVIVLRRDLPRIWNDEETGALFAFLTMLAAASLVLGVGFTLATFAAPDPHDGYVPFSERNPAELDVVEVPVLGIPARTSAGLGITLSVLSGVAIALERFLEGLNATADRSTDDQHVTERFH